MTDHIPEKTILIIQTAFLGDVLLTTPLITALREGITDCQIDFLTIPDSKNILESNPHLRSVITFDKRNRDKGWKGLDRLGKLLSASRYSICITPHRSWRSAYLTRCTAAPLRIGFDISAWNSVFTHRIRYRKDRHEIERNMSLLEPLNLQTGRLVPVVFPLSADRTCVDAYLEDFIKKSTARLFAVAPGSIWPTKRWPAEYYRSVIQDLIIQGHYIALIGGREDTKLCMLIAAGLDNCIVLAGKLTVRQTYQLLLSCKGLLTNDSAPLHLGLAAGIPVFTVFGATVPEFGFAPIGVNGYIFENKGILCRPCGIHGGVKCPIKTFSCMNSITPRQVADKILTLI